MSAYETVIVVGMALWIVIALGLLVAVIYAIGLLRRARAPMNRAAEVLEGLEDRLHPVIRNAERASEEVNYVLGAVRNDASEVSRAVRRVGESTERMVAMVEERVGELSALLEVVQEEAEETFLTTASLLRGLRGGRDAAEAESRRRALRRQASHD